MSGFERQSSENASYGQGIAWTRQQDATSLDFAAAGGGRDGQQGDKHPWAQSSTPRSIGLPYLRRLSATRSKPTRGPSSPGKFRTTQTTRTHPFRSPPTH